MFHLLLSISSSSLSLSSPPLSPFLSLSLLHKRQPLPSCVPPTALFSPSPFLPLQLPCCFGLDVVGTIAATGIASEGMNRFCFQLKISFSWELTLRGAASTSLISYLPPSLLLHTSRFFANYIFADLPRIKIKFTCIFL